MDHIRLYRVEPAYVDYLLPHAPDLFHNRTSSQRNERVYIGILLHVHGKDYFAPLSSFKDKHRRMQETIDFIKIYNFAVINLNRMFPVPQGCYHYVDISQERNPLYRNLLASEYRRIKMIEDKIRKNAKALYMLQVRGDQSSLAKRCNDFLLLEKLCDGYRN